MAVRRALCGVLSTQLIGSWLMRRWLLERRLLLFPTYKHTINSVPAYERVLFVRTVQWSWPSTPKPCQKFNSFVKINGFERTADGWTTKTCNERHPNPHFPGTHKHIHARARSWGAMLVWKNSIRSPCRRHQSPLNKRRKRARIHTQNKTETIARTQSVRPFHQQIFRQWNLLAKCATKIFFIFATFSFFFRRFCSQLKRHTTR